MSSSNEYKILHHPIPKLQDDTKQACLYVYGNPNAKHLIIMSAGYPDNHSAFMPMAKKLASGDSDCLVGVTCPPGYDLENLQLKDYPVDGYKFEDWIINLREAIKTLRQYSTQSISNTTLTGIFHDWGVIMGMMYVNRIMHEEHDGMKLDRIVIYDILVPCHPQTPNKPKGHKNKSMYQKICQMSYMMFLGQVFLLSRYLPTFLTLPFYLMGILVGKIFQIFPVSDGDKEYFEKNVPVKTMDDLQQLWYKMYPYLRVLSLTIRGKIKDMLQDLYLPQDLSNLPILYLYGASKTYDLSSANAVAFLQQEQDKGNGSRVVKVENAGHWLYRQQPELCYNEMTKFFKATMN